MIHRTSAAAREASRIQEMCYDAASRIYSTENQPSMPYQQRVARLLFATIAHESGGFRYRRQLSSEGGYMSPTSNSGAFGLSQCQKDSIMDSVKFVQARPALEQRVRAYLFDWPHWGEWSHMRSLLQTSSGDRLSIALCRLHYLRVPSLVPGDLQAQAEYAKRHYNTLAGKATASDYKEAFEQLWPGGA